MTCHPSHPLLTVETLAAPSACCQVKTLGITAKQSELSLHFGSLGSMLELEWEAEGSLKELQIATQRAEGQKS